MIVAKTGNEAMAYAMKQVNPDVVAAYPITPSTEIVQIFSGYVADGLVDMSLEVLCAEGEFTSVSFPFLAIIDFMPRAVSFLLLAIVFLLWAISLMLLAVVFVPRAISFMFQVDFKLTRQFPFHSRYLQLVVKRYD